MNRSPVAYGRSSRIASSPSAWTYSSARSPVQSSDIYKEIVRLREKYPDIPLYAVVSDMCASGGYYVASAADLVYAPIDLSGAAAARVRSA